MTSRADSVRSVLLLICAATIAFESEFVDALKERGHNVTMFDINLVGLLA